jgi:hypothetical protein
MPDPLFYILAPFLLGFGLFAVFLVVSIILKDPARPFRMFKAPPIDLGEASAECRVQGAEEDPEEQEQGAEETDAGTGGRGDGEQDQYRGNGVSECRRKE